MTQPTVTIAKPKRRCVLQKKLSAVDLFAGCGGLTEGLKQAGFEVIGAVENDPKATLVYRLNHPSVTLWEKDIQKLTGPAILDWFGLRSGELDLLTGCPPCQGFFTLRTKNGQHPASDPENELIFQFLRLVKLPCGFVKNSLSAIRRVRIAVPPESGFL